MANGLPSVLKVAIIGIGKRSFFMRTLGVCLLASGISCNALATDISEVVVDCDIGQPIHKYLNDTESHAEVEAIPWSIVVQSKLEFPHTFEGFDNLDYGGGYKPLLDNCAIKLVDNYAINYDDPGGVASNIFKFVRNMKKGLLETINCCLSLKYSSIGLRLMFFQNLELVDRWCTDLYEEAMICVK